MDETDNTAEAVTDNVTPSDDDNSSVWNLFDPDDDQDNEDVAETEGTEDEDEGEDLAEDEAEETPEDAADDEADQAPKTVSADSVVQLADGSTVTVKDLMENQMRQADYSRKTQELSNDRRRVREDAKRIESITSTFAEYLGRMVPEMPPAELMYSNMEQYQLKKAQHENAMSEVQKLVELSRQPKDVTDAMSQADRQALIQDENAKLASLFPETGLKDGREKFFTSAQSAAEHVGFSAQELQGVTDHRLFALAHWAKKGIEADQARSKAKAKVEKAPPTTPRKPGNSGRSANKNAEAIRNFRRTGSIHDLAKADF